MKSKQWWLIIVVVIKNSYFFLLNINNWSFSIIILQNQKGKLLACRFISCIFIKLNLLKHSLHAGNNLFRFGNFIIMLVYFFVLLPANFATVVELYPPSIIAVINEPLAVYHVILPL